MNPEIHIDPDDPAGCNGCSVCGVCWGCWWLSVPMTINFVSAAGIYHDCPPIPEPIAPK